MKYFTIAELTRTNHSENNIPDAKEVINLVTLVEKVLDPAREEFGEPIKVTSGFRSQKVNILVGGAKSSQHCKGQAADLTCSDNKTLFRILAEMEFDQLIYEFGDENQPSWVHVSYVLGANRNEILRARKSKGRTSYEKIKI